MSLGEIAALSLIIAEFAVFGVTLAWVSSDGSYTANKDSRADTRHSSKWQHPSSAGFITDD